MQAGIGPALGADLHPPSVLSSGNIRLRINAHDAASGPKLEVGTRRAPEGASNWSQRGRRWTAMLPDFNKEEAAQRFFPPLENTKPATG